MAFTIGREQLKHSSNERLLELLAKDLAKGIFKLESTQTEGFSADTPVFIKDFYRLSVQLNGRSFLDFLDDDIPGYKAWDASNPPDDKNKRYLEVHRQIIIDFLKQKYQASKLKEIDFADQLPWVKEIKQMMDDFAEGQKEDEVLSQWKEIYSLLALEKFLRNQAMDVAHYTNSLVKILHQYSQGMKSLATEMYSKYLLSQEFGLYKLELDLESQTADILLSSEGKVMVEFKAHSSVLVESVPVEMRQKLAKGVDEAARKLLPLSIKFELTSNYALLAEIQTEDPIHWMVVMGYDAEGFNFKKYLDGGSAKPLRKAILLSSCQTAKNELNRALAAKVDPDGAYANLKEGLKPVAKKIIAEVDRLVFESADPNNQDIEALATHLISLRCWFEAKDSKEMVVAYDRFLESSLALDRLQAKPDPKKGFTVSHRFAEILKFSLFITGCVLFVIGVALAATGFGLGLGLSLAAGGWFLAVPFAFNLKLPLDNEIHAMNDKAFAMFRSQLPDLKKEHEDVQAKGKEEEDMEASTEEKVSNLL